MIPGLLAILTLTAIRVREADDPKAGSDRTDKLISSFLDGDKAESLRARKELEKGGREALAALVHARLNAPDALRSEALNNLVFALKERAAGKGGKPVFEKLRKVRITLDMQYAPLRAVFDYLREVTGQSFAFESGVKPDKTTVTLKLSEATGRVVLRELCALTSTDYEFREGKIFLAPIPRLWGARPLPLKKLPPASGSFSEETRALVSAFLDGDKAESLRARKELEKGGREALVALIHARQVNPHALRSDPLIRLIFALKERAAGERGEAVFEKLREARVSIDMRDVPISTVVDYLQEIMELNFACDAASGPNDAIVSLKGSDWPLRSVLREICAAAEWDYDFRHGVIFVAPRSRLWWARRHPWKVPCLTKAEATTARASIGLLASDSPIERERASEELRRLGPAARPHLEDGAKSKDAEVAARCRLILSEPPSRGESRWVRQDLRGESLAVAKKLRRMKIDLAFRTTRMEDILAFVRDFTDLNIVWRAKPLDRTVTLNARNLPVADFFELITLPYGRDVKIDDGIVIVFDRKGESPRKAELRPVVKADKPKAGQNGSGDLVASFLEGDKAESLRARKELEKGGREALVVLVRARQKHPRALRSAALDDFILTLKEREAGKHGKAAIFETVRRKRVTIDMQDAPLSAVVDYLREVTGLNFVCDVAADSDDKIISLKVSDQPLATVLRKLCAGVGWDYDVRHGVLFLAPFSRLWGARRPPPQVPSLTKGEATAARASIELLASDSAEERERATERLRKLGPAASLPLEEGAKSGDAEVAARCRAILSQFPLPGQSHWWHQELVGESLAVAKKLRRMKLFFNFENTRMEDILAFVRDFTKLNIVSRTKPSDREFSFKIKGLSVAEALELLTMPLGHDVKIEDGIVIIFDR